jgi:hypothetical protein
VTYTKLCILMSRDSSKVYGPRDSLVACHVGRGMTSNPQYVSGSQRVSPRGPSVIGTVIFDMMSLAFDMGSMAFQ